MAAHTNRTARANTCARVGGIVGCETTTNRGTILVDTYRPGTGRTTTGHTMTDTHTTHDDGTTDANGTETYSWVVPIIVTPFGSSDPSGRVCGATAWVASGHGLAERVACDLDVPFHGERHLDRSDVMSGATDDAWAWSVDATHPIVGAY